MRLKHTAHMSADTAQWQVCKKSTKIFSLKNANETIIDEQCAKYSGQRVSLIGVI